MPRGGSLPDDALWRRHRILLAVLWGHVPGLALFGLLRGQPAAWALLAALPPAVLALGASVPGFGHRRLRPALAAMGLLASSAALVALWDGLPEAHFHFFVMLALVGLYLDWVPYGLAVCFVLVQHGVTGTLAPQHVFAHAGAPAQPWVAALIHMLFVAAVSVVTVASWSHHENARAEADLRARGSAALRRIAEAVARDEAPERLLPDALRELATLMGADDLCAGRVEGIDVRLVATPGGWVAAGDLEALSGDPAVAEVRRTRAAARVVDRATGRARVAAPVNVAGTLWGVLACGADAVPAEAGERLADVGRLVGMGIAQARIRAELEARASEDPLTGLANHRVFHERLAEEVGRAARTGDALALVVLDLDHFKQVNDRNGHPAGDAVLVELARRLRVQARGGDVLARVGGEEFAWLLPGCDGPAALRRAEDLRGVVARSPFPAAGALTISAGVSTLADAGDAAEMVARADQALYWAKRQGRNGCVLHSPELREHLEGVAWADRTARTRMFDTLRDLVRNLDAKHATTRGHSERVAGVTSALATALGWPAARCVELHEAALLHDLGMVAVPDAVLRSPAPLTPGDSAAVRAHPALGAQIAGEVLSREATTWIRGHHERHDGHGYPDGLAGPAIPAGARILAVAEAWDAMTAGRPHRPAREPGSALEELRRHAGRQFAPEVVDALDRLLAEGALMPIHASWCIEGDGRRSRVSTARPAAAGVAAPG
ncbi:MAG TPA: diguanylate cyclase [Miltoncostaeaceae bacterium]|nr:diguanylate cyclase [Miltoncostaeaceae bacterium]